MRSRWTCLCVLLALGCGGGHKPPTDNGPDRPFPFLDDDTGNGTASLDDGGDPEPDGGMGMDVPDSGMGSAGSVSPAEDGGGMAGATGGTGGTGGNAGSEAGGGAGGASGAGSGGEVGDAGMTAFVPNADALPGSWSAQYKVVTCAEEITEELMAGCDTASACASTTLTIDADLNVTGSDLVSMALGSSWADDTLSQTQKDNFGSDSELTLWFVDEFHVLGRVWSAGSPFTGGFEICRGLRATRM